MNIFCKPKARSALAGVSPALGVPQQDDNVNQNSGSFGFCPEKKITWQILQLDCAVWPPQTPYIITVVSKIKELEQNCEQANTEVPLTASGVKALYCKPWNPPVCISFHSCSLCLPQSHLAQWWCSIFPLMSQPCPPHEIWTVHARKSNATEHGSYPTWSLMLLGNTQLNWFQALLFASVFPSVLVNSFLEWNISWMFSLFALLLSFTSFKDKTKHQNKTLRESFSQNFLLCSSPSHRDVLQLPTRVPISVSPSCRQGSVRFHMPGWHRSQYWGPQEVITDSVGGSALWHPWTPSSILSPQRCWGKAQGMKCKLHVVLFGNQITEMLALQLFVFSWHVASILSSSMQLTSIPLLVLGSLETLWKDFSRCQRQSTTRSQGRLCPASRETAWRQAQQELGTWLWNWGFPISLNFVPNPNLNSLGTRATNYHKPLFRSPPFNLFLLGTDFEIQLSSFLCNIPWLAKFTMQNEIWTFHSPWQP